MTVVPRWARAKVLTAKRRRRSTLLSKTKTQRPLMQTMTFSDEYGAIISYRDHVRPNKQEDTTRADVTRWHGYPTEFVAFLSCFDKVPDDQLPPLVAVTRRRKIEWQSTLRGQGKAHTICMTVSVGSLRHIFCFLSGKTAFFVWLSKSQGKARRSADVPASFAQFIVSEVQRNVLYPIEKTLTWVETVDYNTSNSESAT